MHKYYLGIDTSNYTTSVAIVDCNGNVIADQRRLLTVKKGNRGLRQSEAFFQHISNMPELYSKAISIVDPNEIQAVCVSTRPRSVEGSYMPVFKAGESFAKVISDTLKIPLYECSHQEGHIEAIRSFNDVGDNFICYHLSGGTSEILDVTCDDKLGYYRAEIIGGTKDISVGQLIDRLGVAMGMSFPAGKSMDDAALKCHLSTLQVKHIKVDDNYFNLSGIETQLTRKLEEYSCENISCTLFTEILLCIQKTVDNLRKHNKPIVFAGGVSQSRFIRENISKDVIFGAYGSDNAVGTALIGGKKHGHKANKY